MKKEKEILYDYTGMLRAKAGKNGESDAGLDRLTVRLSAIHKVIKQLHKEGELGFMGIPERTDELAAVKKIAGSLKKEFKTLIVVGIGGSDLGARALHAAFSAKRKGMVIEFIGANTDPDEISALLSRVDLRTCAINIISKSGETIEPMSTFLILRKKLIAKVGVKKYVRHIIATTDPESSTLRTIAEREGYRTLPVPKNIGGRFSALTTVGLLAAACAGISVDALLRGAKKERDSFLETAAKKNGPLLFAGLQYNAYTKRGQNIAVLMPYASSMKEFGAWFRQLWAESIGKRKDRKGKQVWVGQTPVAALGATDQHSQLQLWNEGPADKTMTFVEVSSFDTDFTLDNPFSDIEGTSYMVGKKMSDINHIEREATSIALAAHKKPYGTIFIPEANEESLGGLMMFFMLATAVMGELLDINAYNQPGVESMKKAMFSLLGRKG